MKVIELKEVALPFERQPRETVKAYEAFKVYLELGPERSLVRVGQKLGKSRVIIERWSAKYDWCARVKAHGAHLAELERRTIEAKAIEKAVEWHNLTEEVRRLAWRRADVLLEMADDFIQRWKESKRVPGVEGVVRALELAMKLKQFAAGMPSEIKEVNTNVSGTVRVDALLALEKIYGQPLSGEVVDVAEVRESSKLQTSKSKPDQSLLTSAATGNEK